MASAKYFLLIEQGSTLNLELTYKDPSGNPIDLTGYSGRMQIKSNYADNNPTTYLTLSSSIAPDGSGLNFSGSGGINPPESGTIGIIISAISSSMLNFNTAYYDLELYCNNTVTRLLEGQVAISKEVTR